MVPLQGMVLLWSRWHVYSAAIAAACATNATVTGGQGKAGRIHSFLKVLPMH